MEARPLYVVTKVVHEGIGWRIAPVLVTDNIDEAKDAVAQLRRDGFAAEVDSIVAAGWPVGGGDGTSVHP